MAPNPRQVHLMREELFADLSKGLMKELVHVDGQGATVRLAGVTLPAGVPQPLRAV